MILSKLSCWVIFDAQKVGTANQCLGLASALGFENIRAIEVSAIWPWRYLSTKIWPSPLQVVHDKDGTTLLPPWPDVIIAAGRVSAAPAMAIRKLSQRKTFVIQLQGPHLNLELFNLVIAPAHDQLKGKNVIVTKGALHHLTKEKLNQAAAHFYNKFAFFKHPFIAVLIGGTNKRYKLTPSIISSMAEQLKRIAHAHDLRLAITPSRRTEIENCEALQKCFKDFPAFIWDKQGENPYLAMLALAQDIVVTSDSVSMVSEACFTGKPVYIYHLPGGSAMSRRFHTLFDQLGYTQPLKDTLEARIYEPLDDRSYVLKRVQEELIVHRAALKDKDV